MAKKGVRLFVLNVGQGMGNYVEICGNGLDRPPTNTFIYDLGSEKGNKKYGGPAVGFILDRLKKMSQPRIDLITFSHGDKDHWNLFRSLIDRSGKEVPKLKYGDVYYGGTKDQYDYGSSNYNVLNVLKSKDAKVYSPFSNASTCFYKKLPDNTWPLLANYSGFKIRLLLANVDKGVVLFDKKTNTHFTNKNSVSAVIVCEYANARFILTGDATGLTVKKIVELINMQNIQDQVNNTFMLVVPHHGSAVTLKNGEKNPYEAAKKFAEYCDANSITASADFRDDFWHPDYNILEIFCARKKLQVHPLEIGNRGYIPPKDETTYPEHLYTAYEGNDWKPFASIDNIFTTAYTKSRRVYWTFTIDEDGTKSIKRTPEDALSELSGNSPVLQILNKHGAPGSDIGKAKKKKKN
jgi:hypothetical protein